MDLNKEFDKPKILPLPVSTAEPVPMLLFSPNGDFEPELQRQMERSMNYSNFSNPTPKSMRQHRRRHRSSANTKATASEEQITDSSSDSTELKNIPTVKIEESSNEENKISFLDSIRGPISDCHVMLSPRSTFLAREAIDLPPSPPMNQIQVDPPNSRMLGDNEKNSLTRLMLNLKKSLKDLESEYELIFGYRPSHADKLNNKEMKKCLMQLAKVKKDLKRKLLF
jgi:hypothetical protein